VLAAAALLASFPSGAAPVPAALSLEDVLSSVRARYPLIEAARQDLSSAEGEYVSSKGSFDLSLKSRASWDLESYYPGRTFDVLLEQPTTAWGISLLGGYRRGTGSFPVYDGKLQTLDAGEFRGGFSVPLLRDGPTDARRVRVERAEIGVDLARAGLHQQYLESVRLARQRYWEWVASGGKMRVARQLLEIAEKRDLQLQEQFKRGDASKFDVNDNFRGVLQRRSQLESAERLLRRAELELSLYFRDSSGLPLIPERARLPADFPLLPENRVLDEASWNALTDEALQRRPDIRRIQGQREQNERELRLARNQFLPKVDLNLTVSKDVGNGPVELSKTESEAALLLEIPIPFRGARGRIQSAAATDSRIHSQAILASDRVSTEIRDARSALDQARARVQLANQELELALGLEKGERARFAHGDSNLIFVQLREQTTAEAATRRIDSQLDYWVAEASLDISLGLPQL
jgi:outer membrane protein TolC